MERQLEPGGSPRELCFVFVGMPTALCLRRLSIAGQAGGHSHPLAMRLKCKVGSEMSAIGPHWDIPLVEARQRLPMMFIPTYFGTIEK